MRCKGRLIYSNAKQMNNYFDTKRFQNIIFIKLSLNFLKKNGPTNHIIDLL